MRESMGLGGPSSLTPQDRRSTRVIIRQYAEKSGEQQHAHSNPSDQQPQLHLGRSQVQRVGSSTSLDIPSIT